MSSNNPTHNPDRTNNPGDDQYTRHDREEEERRKNPSQNPRDPSRRNPTKPDQDNDNGEEIPR